MSYVSHADLGGRPGCGAVSPEPEGELFHAAWEPRALALTLAMGATGAWNIDMSRAARETLPDYARLSYYRIWIAALEKLLAARGLVLADEVAAGRSLRKPLPIPRVLAAAAVERVLAAGAPTLRPPSRPARFSPGQQVVMRDGPFPHHTRLPRYAWRKRGTIERLHGMHVFADANAKGEGEQPQWLYTVVFEGAELWGDARARGVTVSIDAWEPYLHAA
ncbi:MAG TPA: nitrile hydratase subunit beta [Casimicrobiaceae bacterium]|nr:nitrile hydratase subunit beta [Casimicrobiaceae bacterium]